MRPAWQMQHSWCMVGLHQRSPQGVEHPGRQVAEWLFAEAIMHAHG